MDPDRQQHLYRPDQHQRRHAAVIGNGGTIGSITSASVSNLGALAFNRSDSYTYAGVISGAGVVNQIGAGTTVLTGTNTYTGGTTISAGTLQLGAGGATGSIVGNVVDNGTLTFNRSDAVTFAGLVSGSGAVDQARRGRDHADRRQQLRRRDDRQCRHANGQWRPERGHRTDHCVFAARPWAALAASAAAWS